MPYSLAFAAVPIATGGIITYDGLYTVHTFLANANFILGGALTADVLIVAGGGAGGSGQDRTGGGGGAGGVRRFTAMSLTAGTLPVVVGAGGIGGFGSAGTSGSDSSFNSNTITGGGRGGFFGNAGAAGGSGGGSHHTSIGGGAGTALQGNNGAAFGYDSGSTVFTAAGGGGAGAVGANGLSTGAGAGGIGVAHNISGGSTYYGGGGGGSAQDDGGAGNAFGGAGGLGGGGTGARSTTGAGVLGFNGIANTGGGGGGGCFGGGDGGNGGSGIVIIRYLTKFLGVAGAPTTISITTQPSGASAGAVFTTQPVMQILDAYGRLRTQDNSTVVAAVRASGTGTLSGTLSATAVNGIVTFTNLQYDVVEPMTISFTAALCTPTVSATISVDYPTPNLVANLIAWYSADAIAQSDDTDVLSWSDLSGRGCTLAGAAGQNKLRTNVINGRSVVRYSGTQTSMLNNFDGQFAWSTSFGFSYMAAVRWSAIGWGGVFTNFDTNFGTGDYSLVIEMTQGDARASSLLSINGYVGDALPSPVAGVTEIIGLEWNGASGIAQLYRNNVQAGIDVVVSAPVSAARLSVGSFYYNGGVASLPGAFDIGEFFFHRRPHTTVERTNLYNYLAARWR